MMIITGIYDYVVMAESGVKRGGGLYSNKNFKKKLKEQEKNLNLTTTKNLIKRNNWNQKLKHNKKFDWILNEILSDH